MFELLILTGFIYLICDKLYVEKKWKTVDLIAAICVPIELLLIIGIFASILFGEFQYITFLLF